MKSYRFKPSNKYGYLTQRTTVVLDPRNVDNEENKEAIEILKEQLLADVAQGLHNPQENCNEDKTDKETSKIEDRRGLAATLRTNSLRIIENSTMFVFQWNKSRYTCFCCKQPFIYMSALREHMELHDLQTLKNKIIGQQNKRLKVEISTLNCKLCKKSVTSLDELRHHHQNIHDMNVGDGQDLLVPYKIQSQGLQCQLCPETFHNFRLLSIHVNKHYKNHICDVCGVSFANLVCLNLHKTRMHKKITCNKCNLNFSSRSDKKRHDTVEHNVNFVRKQRFPCPYCDERFFQENYKVQHLVEKHGLTRPEHKCLLCLKVFITRSLLNNHVKVVHKKERKHECDVCHNAFYTKSDVVRHRVTHTGEKNFSCTLCNSPFGTRNSLQRHMKRNACRS